MQTQVLLKKVIAVSTTSLVLGWYMPSGASIEVDIHTLCSKFPLNSSCEGYEAPISLRQRSGIEGGCSLGTGETSQSGKCKIDLTDNQITVYLEQGKPLNILEGKKTTQTITIPMSDVVTLGYQTDTKTPTGRVIRNTLLFGFLGAVLTKPDKLAQIEIGFTESESDQENRNLLTLVTKRDVGSSLRVKLEQLTGINVGASSQETPETKPEREGN